MLMMQSSKSQRRVLERLAEASGLKPAAESSRESRKFRSASQPIILHTRTQTLTITHTYTLVPRETAILTQGLTMTVTLSQANSHVHMMVCLVQ